MPANKGHAFAHSIAADEALMLELGPWVRRDSVRALAFRRVFGLVSREIRSETGKVIGASSPN